MRSSGTACGWRRHRPDLFGIGGSALFAFRPRLALAGLGQDLDVELLAAFLHHPVDEARDGGKVNDFGGFLGRAELAIEVPEIAAFGQFAPPLALDVLADLVLDGFEETVGVLALDLKLKGFSHE